MTDEELAEEYEEEEMLREEQERELLYDVQKRLGMGSNKFDEHNGRSSKID